MKSATITLSFEEWQRVKVLADERMKEHRGHRFQTILKTRCVHCGVGPHVKTRCGGWLQTFVGHLDEILLNLDAERKAGHL